MSLAALEVSHGLYLLAAYRAWKKGYEGYGGLLSSVIILSIYHHWSQETSGSSHAFDFIEGQGVNIVALVTAIQFRKSITMTEVWLLVGASIFYVFAHFSKRHSATYVINHSLWHIFSSLVILGIVDKAPKS
jgi:hypothetical protein